MIVSQGGGARPCMGDFSIEDLAELALADLDDGDAGELDAAALDDDGVFHNIEGDLPHPAGAGPHAGRPQHAQQQPEAGGGGASEGLDIGALRELGALLLNPDSRLRLHIGRRGARS